MYGSRPHLMRVVLVDDHAVVRTTLASRLSGQPDILVVGEAVNGQQAVELCGKLMPDVVIMDLSMPVMNGIEATRIIRAEYPSVRVIGLSMFQYAEQAKPMLEAGAVAYVSKSDSPTVLLDALRNPEVE